MLSCLLGFLSSEFKFVTSTGWYFSLLQLSFTGGLINGERDRERGTERERGANNASMLHMAQNRCLSHLVLTSMVHSNHLSTRKKM